MATNNTTFSNEELLKLGLIPEEIRKMDLGYYQVHAVVKNDGFVEVTNEFDSNGNLTKQFADIRIVREGITDLTYNELGTAIKRFLLKD